MWRAIGLCCKMLAEFIFDPYLWKFVIHGDKEAMSEDYERCEHLDGSVMGKCAICGDMVCSECYRSVYNQMICSGHEELEDESAWEVIGFYSESDALEEARFALRERELTTLVVEADADTIELYVPPEEKNDAWEILTALADGYSGCSSCHAHFSEDIGICPICGLKPSDVD